MIMHSLLSLRRLGSGRLRTTAPLARTPLRGIEPLEERMLLSAAGFSFSALGTLTTSEGGLSEQIEVVLDAAPTADVTISFSSSDTTEGTVDPASLTFTAADWDQPQTVTVSGVDDGSEDGPVVYSLVIHPAESADANYDGLDPQDLLLINDDNDRAGVRQLTNNLEQDAFPLIDGGQVVWAQWEGDDLGSGTGIYSIYAFDGSATICLGVASAGAIPYVDGNQALWFEYSGTSANGFDVKFYDGSQTHTLGDGIPVALDSGCAAWVGGENLDTLFFYDGQTTKNLGEVVVSALTEVRMDEGQVIWRVPDAQAGLVLKYYDGETVRRIGENGFPLDSPQIESGLVVWTEITVDPDIVWCGTPTPVIELYMFDGTNKINLGHGIQPYLDSGQVAWINPESGDLLFYDGSSTLLLESGANANLTNYVVDNGQVAWMSDASGESEIHFYDGTFHDFGPGMLPQLDQGQIAWVRPIIRDIMVGSGISHVLPETYSVMFYDGVATRELGTGLPPILEDGKVVWMGPPDVSSIVRTGSPWPDIIYSVMLFDGGHTRMLAQRGLMTTTGAAALPPYFPFSDMTPLAIDDGQVPWMSWDGYDYEIYLYTPVGTPDAPVAADVAYWTKANGTLEVAAANGALSNDYDPNGDVLSAHLVTTTLFGELTLHTDGSFTYVPDEGFMGIDAFTYQASDGAINSNVVTAYIDVRAAAVSVVDLDYGTTEDGGSSRFALKLDTQPTADVTVEVSSSDLTEGTVSTGSLVFTPANWDQPQLVILTGQDDQEDDGDVTYTFVIGPLTSDDPDYDGLDPENVPLVNADNDLYDFGDAPDPDYPTFAADGGAAHILDLTGPFLGASVDGEPDAYASAAADGDDLTDGSDDEDGVQFTLPLIAGETAAIQVTASGEGLLQAWIDFNGDGDWADDGEQIFTNEPLNAEVKELQFAVPADATATSATYARFRFSTQTDLAYSGLADDGEVEDYPVGIFGADQAAILFGRTLYVRGTDTPNRVEWVGSEVVVTVDDQEGRFWAADIDLVKFQGGAAADALVYTGDATNEAAKLWTDRAEFTRGGHTIMVNCDSVELIQAFMQKGNDDQVEVYGTDASGETLYASWYHAILETAVGVDLDVYGHERLSVDGGAGDDMAFLSDSKGDDHFYTDPTGSTITDSGDTYSIETIGFPRTFAQASVGHDTAEVHDTSGDDGMLAYRGMALVYDEVYENKQWVGSFFRRAKDFEEFLCVADGGAGTRGDMASIHDTVYDDEFVASPIEATMTLDTGAADDGPRVVTARGFMYAYAYAVNGGHDTADLTDSASDDEVMIRFDIPYTKIYSPPGAGPWDYVIRAKGFDEIDTHSTGGHDKAYVYDSYGQDTFTARPDSAEITTGTRTYRLDSFPEVRSYSTRGGDDIAYLYGSELYADEISANLPGSDADRWAAVVSGSSSPLDYYYYIYRYNEAHAEYHGSTDDTSGIDPSTADWLFADDLDPP